MQKIRTFFRTLALSLVSPAYYADIRSAKTSFSWQYFLLFQALFALAVALRITWPVSRFDLNSFSQTALSTIPADLRIDVHNGRLSINQALPFRIGFPAQWQQPGTPSFSFVTFVDEQAVKSARDVYNYNSIVVIAPSTVYVLKDMQSGELRTFPIPEDESGELTGGQVEQFRQQLMNKPFIKNKGYVPVIGVALWVLLYPALLIGKIITIALYSLVVVLIGSLFFKATNLKYGEAFRLGLHAITPVMVLSLLLEWVGRWHVGGWAHFGFYLVFMVLVLSQMKGKSRPAARLVSTKSAHMRSSHKKKR